MIGGGGGDSWGRETERDKEMDTEKGRDREREIKGETQRDIEGREGQRQAFRI